MKDETWIQDTLTQLKADDRLTYPAATVFANAPLALIQTSLEARVHLLETILELPKSVFPLKKQST